VEQNILVESLVCTDHFLTNYKTLSQNKKFDSLMGTPSDHIIANFRPFFNHSTDRYFDRNLIDNQDIP